jgi:hypothetical protein
MRGKKTGGRRKGTRNKRTAELLASIEASGLKPLQYMLKVMNDAKADISRRDAMALAAAPYVHSRLAQTVERTVLAMSERTAFTLRAGTDLSALTDAELLAGFIQAVQVAD